MAIEQNVLLFTFANSDIKPLLTLKEEYEELHSLLQDRHYKQHFVPFWIPFSSTEQITRHVLKYNESLFLFHFGGHAGRDSLVQLDGKASIEGIAQLFSQCNNLKVVILNGCSTGGQVEQLLAKGVPIIIATSAPVEDRLATRFAINFYSALEKGETLNKAFEIAKGDILQVRPNQKIFRGFPIPNEDEDAPLWGIFYKEENEALLNLKLPDKTMEKTFPPSPYLWKDIETARIHFSDWEDLQSFLPNLQKYPYQYSEKIGSNINEIRSYLNIHNGSIRILGLPGLGKTRLALEVFRLQEGSTLDPNLHYGLLYYDVSHENSDLLLGYVNELRVAQREGVLFIDNCPQLLHDKLKRKLAASKLRLLTIGSSQKDIEAYERKELNTEDPVFFLTPRDFKPVIRKILQSIDPSLSNETLDRLEKFADGFPLIAMLLANDISKQAPNMGMLNDRELAERLLGISEDDKETYPLLKACAIFERFGYYEDLRKELEIIGNSDVILGPDLQPGSKTVKLLDRICKKYKEVGIFEQRGRYLQLKPKPLALRLAADWWRYCNVEDTLTLLKEISNSNLSEALCDQLR